MVRTKQYFQDLFVRGYKPSQQDYSDLMDTLMPYKKWSGFIMQSGTNDPVITTLENTMGVDPVVSRVAPGIYELAFPGKIPDVDKCLTFPNTNGAVSTDMAGNMTVAKTLVGAFNPDQVLIYSFYEGSLPADSLLQNGYNLEIRVYP